MLCLFLNCLSFAAIILHLWGNKTHTFRPLCSTDNEVDVICSSDKVCIHTQISTEPPRCISPRDSIGAEMKHIAISCFSDKEHIYLRNKHFCANIEKLMLIGLLHVNYLNHYVNVENIKTPHNYKSRQLCSNILSKYKEAIPLD